ncbi:CRIB domain-containing protein RIC10 isoform X2 [Brachypodium distachyon]|nr:CRIB domain-containing protein RIC10 isoform X2 [Brachypodium distachyon]|eukprot:XP_010240464.1 CRIB domain-containing protein RIC10 isoform X2 [Brachypodium distachyon]
MEIGSPTDVKHVAHIGWNSSTLPPMTNASPSFRMDASALGISCDFSSLGNLAPSAAAATSWASSQDFEQHQAARDVQSSLGLAVSENTAQDAGGAAPDMPPAGESPVDSSMSEDSVASASLAPTAAASDEAVGASGRLLQ